MQSSALAPVYSAPVAAVEELQAVHPPPRPDVDLLWGVFGLVVRAVQSLPPVSEPLAALTSIRSSPNLPQPPDVLPSYNTASRDTAGTAILSYG